MQVSPPQPTRGSGKSCKIPAGFAEPRPKTDFVKFELENASDDKDFGNRQHSQNGVSVID